ncbi:DMT family transporter [Tissierella sp. MSJ-40]|uniref:DMT family transporter n=1 Tax=Tissierella simiarum TaxID=2841534 RepID=A0ABS6EB00_9FIRM|nr:DMT family transporter [Tissierella simiarum]MBU5440101.1 DMT family transporter [Tissierella simiarum]
MYATGIIGGGSEKPITRSTLLIRLGSGIAYALYSVIGRIALKKYNWLTVITYTFLFASIALLASFKMSDVLNTAFTEKSLILNIILLGGLSTLLPFLLYTKGLEHMDTGKATILTFTEPIVATVIGTTVFQEVFTRYTAIGIALVVFQ